MGDFYRTIHKLVVSVCLYWLSILFFFDGGVPFFIFLQFLERAEFENWFGTCLWLRISHMPIGSRRYLSVPNPGAFCSAMLSSTAMLNSLPNLSPKKVYICHKPMPEYTTLQSVTLRWPRSLTPVSVSTKPTLTHAVAVGTRGWSSTNDSISKKFFVFYSLFLYRSIRPVKYVGNHSFMFRSSSVDL